MLTENGFEIKRLPEILEDLEAGQKVIFPNLILDPSTPDSQLTSLFAEQIAVNHEIALSIYNGIDPLTATGVALDRTVALNYVVRLKGSPTLVEVTFTGGDGTIIPIGAEVSASSQPDIIFKTTESGTVSGGTVVLPTEADTDGNYYIPAAGIDGMPSLITGITSVTNASEGISGRFVETDSQLRARREKALAVVSTSMVDSIRSAVLAVSGATDAVVYENSTDTIDSNSVKPHSVYVVASGGSDDDIATAIMSKKSIGCDMNGTTSVTFYDESGFPHTVLFERPATLDIYIKVIVDAGGVLSPGMEAEIKTLIIDYINDVKNGEDACYQGEFGIGDDVPASLIYPALLNEQEFTVNIIYVGIATDPTGQIVTVPFDQVSNFLEANIQVEHTP